MKTIAIIIGIIGAIFLIVYGISKIPATKYLTNDEIISETKKCIDAGMTSGQIVNGFSFKVTDVICEPIRN